MILSITNGYSLSARAVFNFTGLVGSHNKENWFPVAYAVGLINGQLQKCEPYALRCTARLLKYRTTCDFPCQASGV